MPERGEIVINTGPLIALAAALDGLGVLRDLYRRVHVPNEVGREIGAKGAAGFAAVQFEQVSWLHKAEEPLASVPMLLKSTLDAGEASVIHYA